jgi:tetratricopeptide (TPR) repeat protein
MEPSGQSHPPEASYPPEYLQGIALFNAGDYFEAHEAWESLWLSSSGSERVFFQGLVQLAAAMHHYSHGHYGAARRIYEKARSRLGQVPSPFLALDLTALIEQFDDVFSYDVVERQRSGIRANAPPRLSLIPSRSSDPPRL